MVVVRRPDETVRLSPAQWLFDPVDVQFDDIDPRGLLGMLAPLALQFDSLPSEWA